MAHGTKLPRNRMVIRQWAAGQGGYPSQKLPRIFELMQMIAKKHSEMKKLENALNALRVETYVDLRECVSVSHDEQPERREYLEMCWGEANEQARRMAIELSAHMMKLYYEGWV